MCNTQCREAHTSHYCFMNSRRLHSIRKLCTQMEPIVVIMLGETRLECVVVSLPSAIDLILTLRHVREYGDSGAVTWGLGHAFWNMLRILFIELKLSLNMYFLFYFIITAGCYLSIRFFVFLSIIHVYSFLFVCFGLDILQPQRIILYNAASRSRRCFPATASIYT